MFQFVRVFMYLMCQCFGPQIDEKKIENKDRTGKNIPSKVNEVSTRNKTHNHNDNYIAFPIVPIGTFRFHLSLQVYIYIT